MNYRIDNHGMGMFEVDGVPTRRGYTLSSYKRVGADPLVQVDPEVRSGETLVRTVDDNIYIVSNEKKITDLELFGVSVVVDPVNPDCRVTGKIEAHFTDPQVLADFMQGEVEKSYRMTEALKGAVDGATKSIDAFGEAARVFANDIGGHGAIFQTYVKTANSDWSEP